MYHKSISTMLKSILILSLGFGICNTYAKQKQGENMKTVTEELKEMGHNVKEFTKSKSDTYGNRIESTMERMRERTNEIKDDTKTALLQRYDQAKTQYDEIKAKSKDKKDEAYHNLLQNLEELNDDIEKSIQEENKK